MGVEAAAVAHRDLPVGPPQSTRSTVPRRRCRQALAHAVQSREVAPTEAAQEGAQGGAVPLGKQRIGVVNAVTARQRKLNQSHHLVALVSPPQRAAQVMALPDELWQAGALGEGGRQGQPGIGHRRGSSWNSRWR